MSWRAGADLRPGWRVDTATSGICKLAFSPDGKHIWAATVDGAFEMYSAATGTLLHTVEASHRDTVTCLEPHPSGDLFTGSFDKVLKLWDVQQGPAGQGKRSEAHQSFIGHSGAVTGAAMAGSVVVTSDAEDSLLFWRCKLPAMTALTAPSVDPSNGVGQELAALALTAPPSGMSLPLPALLVAQALGSWHSCSLQASADTTEQSDCAAHSVCVDKLFMWNMMVFVPALCALNCQSRASTQIDMTLTADM